jgi:hypothetical protein
MKTLTITGKDEFDVEQKLCNWRSVNPRAVVTTKHAVERLELRMQYPKKYEKILAPDTVSIRIDYDD